MYCIETETLQLRLEVVPVEALLQHEEILPHLVDKLVYEFKNWANLQNPIIVDNNNIVLDGNHRAFVFKKLNFRYIPVCRIDYLHEKAQLRYWFRLLGNVNQDDLKAIVAEIGVHLHLVEDREVLEEHLKENPLACGIQGCDFHALISFGADAADDAVGAYHCVERIQELLSERGATLSFIPCHLVYEGKFCNLLKDDELIIWTPHITKEMVVEAAKKKRLFAPKTTRHCIPARPLNVNVPTSWFKDTLSFQEINRKFSEFLEAKGVRRFSPGQVIDGRYYEEEIFVFFDK